MTYIELTFSQLYNESLQEMLSAMLSTVGCDSFFEDVDCFKAYCPTDQFNRKRIDTVLTDPMFGSVKLLSAEPLEDKNWNAIWESNYDPVLIADRCFIRAPFHEPNTSVEFDLVIEPKMSFGTAHHETTSQMIQLLLDTDVNHCSLLDMGSGTAVLAILARKLGANPVVAIDNDQWAYNNAVENVKLNQTDDILVELGDASSIGNRSFDVILANINRNILLSDMKVYAMAMHSDSRLMLSGFYETDLDVIKAEASQYRLKFESSISKNNWVAALFTKA